MLLVILTDHLRSQHCCRFGPLASSSCRRPRHVLVGRVVADTDHRRADAGRSVYATGDVRRAAAAGQQPFVAGRIAGHHHTDRVLAVAVDANHYDDRHGNHSSDNTGDDAC